MSDSIGFCSFCGKPLVLKEGRYCASCGGDIASLAVPIAEPADAAADAAVARAPLVPLATAGSRGPRRSVLVGLGAVAVLVVLTAAIATGILLGGRSNATPPPNSQIAALDTPTGVPTDTPAASQTASLTASPTAAPTAPPTVDPNDTPWPTDSGIDGCGGPGVDTPIASRHLVTRALAAPAFAAPRLAAPAATAAALDLAPGHFGPAGALLSGGGYDSATLLPNGKVLFMGGGSDLRRAELYDPGTDQFAHTGAMVEGRQSPLAVLLPNGKVLVAGGYTGGCALGNIGSVELYDPATGHFTSLGSPMPGSGYLTATLLSDGKVLFTGGTISDDAHPDGIPSCELYDPATNTFTPTGVMVHNRSGATATLLPDHTVLFAGGYDDTAGNVTTAELYRPDHGDFVAVGTMTSARNGATATLLSDGRVLIAGGSTEGTDAALASAELYDPNTGTFSPAGSMTIVRWGHTATLLPGDRVLVTGGGAMPESGVVGQGKSTEVWSGGTFKATAGLPTHDHYYTTATLLPNGKVLVVGDGTADLYQP